jgi:cell division protein FtsX
MGKLGGDAIVVTSLIWAFIPIAAMCAGVMIQWLRTQERLRCIEKGIPLPPWPVRPALNLEDRIAAMRMAGMLCVAISLGLLVLFAALAATIPQFAKGVMAVPAIPLFIGAAFLIEYRIRRKEAQAGTVTR